MFFFGCKGGCKGPWQMVALVSPMPKNQWPSSATPTWNVEVGGAKNRNNADPHDIHNCAVDPHTCLCMYTYVYLNSMLLSVSFRFLHLDQMKQIELDLQMEPSLLQKLPSTSPSLPRTNISTQRHEDPMGIWQGCGPDMSNAAAHPAPCSNM